MKKINSDKVLDFIILMLFALMVIHLCVASVCWLISENFPAFWGYIINKQ